MQSGFMAERNPKDAIFRRNNWQKKICGWLLKTHLTECGSLVGTGSLCEDERIVSVTKDMFEDAISELERFQC